MMRLPDPQKATAPRGSRLRLDADRRSGVILLTEAVIALTILLVGILASVLLFGRSEDTSAKTVAETQSALFADGVLSGLRAASADAAEDGCWGQFWDRMGSGATGISAAASVMWANDTSLVVRAGTTNTLDYHIYRHHTDQATTWADRSIRYRLSVTVSSNHWPNPDRASATLEVWPDMHAEPFVFYAEYDSAPGAL